MAYPQELLDSAISFYQVDPKTQATLRRAVSTAYYSLFHFLIEETCRNWARPEQRGYLARVFDHKTMLSASNRNVEKHKNAPLDSKELLNRNRNRIRLMLVNLNDDVRNPAAAQIGSELHIDLVQAREVRLRSGKQRR
jgi:hypothetical protein